MRDRRSGTVAHDTIHLATLLNERRDEIVDRWVKSVRGRCCARTMIAPVLIDHVPALLDDIVRLAADLPTGGAEAWPGDETVRNALRPPRAGFDLEEVVQEHGELRTAILEVLDAGGQVLHPGELTMLNRTLDLAMAQAAASHAAAQQRVLRAVDRLSDVTRARETLLAVVSDDLRNPLAAIMTAAGLLLTKASEAEDDTTRRGLETVLHAASQMDRLIGDLLDTSSIQTGRLSMDRHLQPLAAIVIEAQSLHHPLALEKGVKLTFDVELIDVECVCDRDRILQVMSNVISNALRSCKSGDSIQVWATAFDTQALIEIADTGPGISPGELPHLFEPHRSDGLRTSHTTGLGLFISKGIIEAHGGQLWAHSEPGRGNTLRFTLPVTMSADPST